ncbi:MAG: DinB family protein [Gemmatimonadaceae bacterium]
MLPDLHAHFAQLEDRRADLARHLARYTPRQLGAAPAPGAWSLLGVVEHLVLVDRAVLRAIKRQADRPPLAHRWHHRVLAGVIARALESRVRLPVAGRSLQPRGGASLEGLLAEWDAVRADWRAYLDGITDRPAGELVFRHPLGVPMTAGETLHFLRQHFDHHLHQIARIERSGVLAEPVREGGATAAR